MDCAGDHKEHTPFPWPIHRTAVCGFCANDRGAPALVLCSATNWPVETSLYLSQPAWPADASKKWNEETGKWERRYDRENPLSFARKQLTYWGAKAKQSQALNQRPDINTLSDRGVMPGEGGGMYMAKGGTVRVGENGPVCGTWSAQPITTSPASYPGGN